MKKLIVLFTVFALSFPLKAQLSSDQSQILALAFSAIEMDATQHMNENNLPVLVVEDNGVLPTDTVFEWFGNPISLKTDALIIAAGIKVYIVFDSFTVSDTSATMGIAYVRHGNSTLHYIFQFYKDGNTWVKEDNKQNN